MVRRNLSELRWRGMSVPGTMYALSSVRLKGRKLPHCRRSASTVGSRCMAPGLPVKPPPDRTHRLPALPTIPDLSPLSGRVVNATTVFHDQHSIFLKRLECCVDRLRPPPIAAVGAERSEWRLYARGDRQGDRAGGGPGLEGGCDLRGGRRFWRRVGSSSPPFPSKQEHDGGFIEPTLLPEIRCLGDIRCPFRWIHAKPHIAVK
jgi:hypothetical protein